MSLSSKMLARVRQLALEFISEGDENNTPAITAARELVVVQGLPELAEVVRFGNSWQAIFATGVAALTALPTTVAGLSLYNGENANGNSYIIDSFGTCEEVIDATQADTSALFACNNVAQVTAPTPAAITVRSLSGRKYGGHATIATGATIVNDGWFPHGAEAQSPLAPAVAGAIWKISEAKVRGLYIVPPGGQFNTQVVKAAAAALQQFHFVRWHERRIAYQS